MVVYPALVRPACAIAATNPSVGWARCGSGNQYDGQYRPLLCAHVYMVQSLYVTLYAGLCSHHICACEQPPEDITIRTVRPRRMDCTEHGAPADRFVRDWWHLN